MHFPGQLFLHLKTAELLGKGRRESDVLCAIKDSLKMSHRIVGQHIRQQEKEKVNDS